MIILFDTYAGLCNQMYDIISAIKFMKEYRIPICFRYASFRKSNLVQFYPVPFQNLFSEEPFLNETYYIPYHSIEKDIKSGDKVNKTELSKIVATKLAKKAQEKKITKIYFDRGIYRYHGRVRVFAETLRENGMEF